MDASNSKILENFGKYNFVTFHQNKFDFISNFFGSNDYSEQSQIFKTFCNKILTNNISDVNAIAFNNLLFLLLNRYPQETNDLIFEIFDEETIKFSDILKKNLSENKFNIEFFINKYKNFYSCTQKLIYNLAYFESKIQRDQNCKQFSQLNLIRSYLFYKNVINHKYDYNMQNTYLYEIFSKIISFENTNMETILKLFNMKQYYYRLSHIPKQNKEQLFNFDQDRKFLVNLGSNQDFVKNLVIYINTKIIEITKSKETLSENSQLVNLIKFVSNFDEKNLFFMYYVKCLENRLLNHGTDIELEKSLIKYFKTPQDNKIIQNMMYKIEDIYYTNKYKEHFVKLTVQISSEKYKNLDLTKLNREIMNMKILRFYAWEDSKYTDITHYDVPNELSPYIDIFNKYFVSAYPNREIKWNFDLGTAIIKIKFNKIYQFKVTTSQLFLILQLKNKQKKTALQLSENMGIPLSKLGPVINSLLTAQLIERNDESDNDPKMTINLNENFEYSDENISLVNLMPKQIITTNDDKEINEKFAMGRENILQARIVKVMKINQQLDFNSLLNLARKEMPFDFDDSMFAKSLELCIKQLYIKKMDQNQFKYIENIEDSNEDEDN
ncbi:Cullin family protein [uncultured virus]|nr:Cullin family protein [uncultured virus]